MPLRVAVAVTLPLRVGVGVLLELRDKDETGVPLPLLVRAGVDVRVPLAVLVALRVEGGVTVLAGDPLRVVVLDCVAENETFGVRVVVLVVGGVREAVRQM